MIRSVLVRLGLITIVILSAILVAYLGFVTYFYMTFETRNATPLPAGLHDPVTVEWNTPVDLSAARPLAVRAIRVSTTPTDSARAAGARLTVRARVPGEWSGTNPAAPDVRVWVFDQATGVFPAGTRTSREAFLDDGQAAFGNHPGTSCTADKCVTTYLAVVRWMTPTQGAHIAIALSASVQETVRDLQPAGAMASLPPAEPGIVEVPELAFDGPSAGVSARLDGATRFTAEAPTMERRVTLHVPAALLGERPSYPLAGRVFLRVAETGRNAERDTGINEFLVGAGGDTNARVPGAVDAEWLSGCVTGQDCDVPLTMRLELVHFENGMQEALPPDAWIEASWTLEADLERLAPGGAQPGGAPMTLTFLSP
jgi:hypothetical protein